MPTEEIAARTALAQLLEGHGRSDLAAQVRAVPELEVNTLILGLWHEPADRESAHMVEELGQQPRFLSGDEVEKWKRRFRVEALFDHPTFLLGIRVYEVLYESMSE